MYIAVTEFSWQGGKGNSWDYKACGILIPTASIHLNGCRARARKEDQLTIYNVRCRIASFDEMPSYVNCVVLACLNRKDHCKWGLFSNKDFQGRNVYVDIGTRDDRIDRCMYSMWLYNVNVPFLQNERNYRFFKTVEKRTFLLSNGNDRRTLRFQTIQRANSMATRVRLRSFQSSTNASVVSPVSDRSIAYEIVTFCTPFDAVRKTGTVESCVQRCVQRSNRSIKTERKRNGTLTL